MAVRALERCAYCRREVPVTWIDIPADYDSPIVASVAVCETCWLDGR